jgi:hypothetical protein
LSNALLSAVEGHERNQLIQSFLNRQALSLVQYLMKNAQS